MKRIITLSLCALFIFCSNSNAQVVQSYELIEEYTKDELQDVLTDFGIPSSILPMKYDIEVYKIIYNTPNGDGSAMTIASGAAAYPKGYICNMPLACYAHGTSSDKEGVPSYGSSELNIGMLWAGSGYVSALPDYLGLGDSPGMHPYVHSKSEATASIDMIRATKELGATLGHVIGDDLFLFGYSQGGHAAVATFKEIQENHADEMTVTACYGMSGPYDVAGVQTDFINSGQPYATPGYLPFIFIGYQSVYGNLYNNSISEALASPYDVTLPPLFDGTNGIGYINGQCPSIPTEMVVPAYQNDFDTNPNNPFRLALEDNSLIHWKPESPIRMYYCTEDEQVHYTNALVARDSFLARGATDVFAKDWGPQDHGGCVQYCLLNGFFSMDSFTMGPVVLLETAYSIEESTAGAMDGSIQLVPDEDAGALTYTWSTGATSQNLEGIGPGDYTVTISSDLGCEKEITFNFDALLDNEDLRVEDLSISPNPTTGILQIDIPQLGNYQIDVMDISGKKLLEQQVNAEGNYTMDVGSLSQGMYFIQMQDVASGQRYVTKFLKN